MLHLSCTYNSLFSLFNFFLLYMFRSHRLPNTITINHQMMLQCPQNPLPFPMETKWKPHHVELAPSCPRCASSNTKFCYYNNYSLSQPRYFCKGCRRYWTKGGSLRNVPVGGGCRKSRRARSSSSSFRGAVSMNYDKNLSSNSSCSSTSVDSMIQESGSSSSSNNNNNNNNNGSEIDLAVVFAKYLNQESRFQPEYNNGQEFSEEPSDQVINSLSPPDSSDLAIIDQIQASNLLLEDGFLLQNQYQQENQQRIEEMMMMENQELAEFGLQSYEEVPVQDGFWSTEAHDQLASLSNVTWQLPNDEVQVQVQEEQQDFNNSFTVDEQLKISSNYLMTDHNSWSSFDLSAGFDIFSRPY